MAIQDKEWGLILAPRLEHLKMDDSKDLVSGGGIKLTLEETLFWFYLANLKASPKRIKSFLRTKCPKTKDKNTYRKSKVSSTQQGEIHNA